MRTKNPPSSFKYCKHGMRDQILKNIDKNLCIPFYTEELCVLCLDFVVFIIIAAVASFSGDGASALSIRISKI